MNRYAPLRASAITEWHAAAIKLVGDPDQLVASIENAFPPVDRLDRHFTFAVNLFQISVPERLQADLISAADQQAVIQARHQTAVDANARINAGLESFVGDCVASLRQQTAELCEEMLASFKDGKTGVHQKTLNRLVSFMDQFKALNFAGDQQLEQRLEEVRKQFLTRTAEEYRDSASARRKLDVGIKNLADAARELARSDAAEIVQRFGQMGVRRLSLADAA